MLNYLIIGVGVLIFLGLAFEIYSYVRKHPQALASLEARVSSLETAAQSEVGALIAEVRKLVGSKGTAVPVATVPSPPPPPAPAVPVAVAHAAPAPNVTQVLFPINALAGTGTADAPAPSSGSQPYQPRTLFDRFMDFAARNPVSAAAASLYTIVAPQSCHITFDVAECPGTTPGGVMTISITDTGGNVVGYNSGPFSTDRGAGFLAVQGLSYRVTLTYTANSLFDMNIKTP